MLVFPKTLSPKLHSVLEKTFAAPDEGELVGSLCDAARVLFNARSVICSLSWFRGDDLGFDEYYDISRSRLADQQQDNQRIAQVWIEQGIHEDVSAELRTRLSSVSYSAFSWPYSHVVSEDPDQLSLPAEYTLLIPMTSSLIVTTASDRPFFGYLAVFFDEFPDLTEEVIHLIVDLPDLLSHSARLFRQETTAQRLRQTEILEVRDDAATALDPDGAERRAQPLGDELLETSEES